MPSVKALTAAVVGGYIKVTALFNLLVGLFAFFGFHAAKLRSSLISFGRTHVLGKKSNSNGYSFCKRFKFFARNVLRVI